MKAGLLEELYSGGALDLAADAAADGTKGLFFDRYSSLVHPYYRNLNPGTCLGQEILTLPRCHFRIGGRTLPFEQKRLVPPGTFPITSLASLVLQSADEEIP